MKIKVGTEIESFTFEGVEVSDGTMLGFGDRLILKKGDRVVATFKEWKYWREIK